MYKKRKERFIVKMKSRNREFATDTYTKLGFVHENLTEFKTSARFWGGKVCCCCFCCVCIPAGREGRERDMDEEGDELRLERMLLDIREP